MCVLCDLDRVTCDRNRSMEGMQSQFGKHVPVCSENVSYATGAVGEVSIEDLMLFQGHFKCHFNCRCQKI